MVAASVRKVLFSPIFVPFLSVCYCQDRITSCINVNHKNISEWRYDLQNAGQLGDNPQLCDFFVLEMLT